MTPTMILTRPAAQSASFAAEIARAWARPLEIIQSPLVGIEIQQVSVGDVDSVIFTSLNGVTASAQFDFPKGMNAWCVGARTAQAAQEAGFAPIIGPGDADGLVQSLLAARPTGRFAHIRGTHARGDICVRLTAGGMQCRDVVAYDQQALYLTLEARDVLDAQRHVLFPLFSPRTSTILSNQGPFDATVHVVALSKAVADAVDPVLQATYCIAAKPDGAAMIEAVLSELERLTSQ